MFSGKVNFAVRCFHLGKMDCFEEVQVGNDKEKAQSEKYSHSRLVGLEQR